MKNHFLLKALFGAFLILKLADVDPFSGWSWYIIFLPLVLHFLHALFIKIWADLGLAELWAYEIATVRYDLLMKKEIRRAEKNNRKNQVK